VRRPVVGVTGYIVEPETALGLGFGERQLDVAAGTYLRWIREQGMIPVPLPYHAGDLHEDYLDLVDGLLMSGGADIHPERYGADPHPYARLEPKRDTFEFGLVRAAFERDLPILGICRGMQILNVSLGGTMHQHLPERSTELIHSSEFRDGQCFPDERWLPAYHEVLVEDPELRELTGEVVTSNSYHHQGVAQLGDGLRVAARATDGLVEALVGVERPVLGVQWHPEMHEVDERAGLAPFRWLARRLTGARVELATAELPTSPAPAGLSLN
jgi:putative glutamine amidotransferase